MEFDLDVNTVPLLKKDMNQCPFCRIPQDRVVARSGECIAFYDLFPVSQGHLLIIPLRHVASFTEVTEEEWVAVHQLASQLIHDLRQKDAAIQGFNWGINDGTVAGQTVFHAHLHLIPRRSGDVPHPRGGVRGVIPDKKDYPQPGRPCP